jgi:cellulose synthase/poly-beta-1,6-N-acetylglucosamine synthase-like glycosyltransferase
MAAEGSCSGSLCTFALMLIYVPTIIVLVCLTTVVTTLFLQILFAGRARGQNCDLPSPAASWPRVAVLVPAHNEGAGIIATLTDAKSQLRAKDRLLVVADNCDDDTAAVVRAQGAEVRERRDPDHRGKGYALSAGVAYLSEDPPDIVIAVDADCRILPGAIGHLALACARNERPIQANYMMCAPAGATLRYDVAEFAWRVKNFIRPFGLYQFGLPCQLTGSGMAFPWRTISTANLASGDIVEDMALGIELAIRGEPPLFCPQAIVTSTFPLSDGGRETQRRRWQHGHFQTIVRSFGPLICRGLANRQFDQVALALDLAIPPLSALASATSAVLALSFMLLWFGLGAATFYVAVANAIILLLAVMLAWLFHGRDILPLSALPKILPYVLDQLRVYRLILKSKGPPQWTPTDRK